VFVLVIGFIEHLHTQLVTTGNCNSLTGLHILKIIVNHSTHVVFLFFHETSSFLVAGPNIVLCLRSYRLANIPQMSKRKFTLRRAVYRQSVHLGVKPLQTQDQRFFFSTEPLRP
jgi:hypothetical protein